MVLLIASRFFDLFAFASLGMCAALVMLLTIPCTFSMGVLEMKNSTNVVISATMQLTHDRGSERKVRVERDQMEIRGVVGTA